LPVPIKIVENFLAFSTGFRKPFLFWIDRTKTPGTKAARRKQPFDGTG